MEKKQIAQTEKQDRFNKIFQIMSIYIKYLLADAVTIEEENAFLEYCQNSIYHKLVIMKNTHLVMKDPSQYFNDKDYSMGDIILQFPNPDEMPFEVISYKEAMQFLQKTVGTRCAVEFQNEQLDYAILHMAFQYAYSKLTDSRVDDNELEKESNGNEIQTSMLESAVKLFFKGNNDFLKITDNYGDFVGLIQSKILASLNKFYQEPKYSSKQKRHVTPIIKKKLLTKGKFIIKTVQGPERSGHLVQDFLTLSRNLVLLRLSQKGFNIRSFISSDNKSIYAVLFSAESNISIVAEQIKMKKFLNLEFTDLLSLEPIDTNFRPLRLNNRLWRNDLDQNQSDYFQYVKPKIINLLRKINFKKMAKELHIQNINDQMFDYGQRDLIGDEEGPSDELWEAYYEYLVYLEQRVTEAREKFYFKLDFAVEMNPPRIKKQCHQPQVQYSKQQLRRESRKVDIKTSTVIEETTRTQKEEQQIKKYFSYWRKKKFIPKKTRKHQHFKELKENPLTICDTQKIDFTQIILEELQHILKDLLSIEVPINQGNVEFYLKQLQHYFDEEEEAVAILQKFIQPDTSMALTQIIQQLCILMMDSSDNQGLKSYSITRDKNPVYYEIILRQLIEQLFLTYMKQEENVWKQQIEEEKQQFQNIKKVLHLKWGNLCTKFLKERQRELLAQAYGSAMRDGMLIINNAKGNQLKCIWDYSFGEVNDISISSEYSVAGKGFSFKKKSRINTIWRKYQISESGRISVFSLMERIKLVNYIVNQTINVPFIFNEHYINQIFGLNDEYELQGLSNKRYFSIDGKSLMQTTPGSDNLEYIRLLQERDLIAQSLFVKPKLHNLEELWKISWGEIWYVPQNEIREYYGEKIALYFSFLGHYTKSLLIPGILGLICTIIQIFTPARVAIIFGMLYGIAHSSFLALLNGTWKLKEKQIVAQFAQNINKGNQQQEQRPAFKGEFRRDPQNDEFNTLFYPFSKLFAHMIFNGLMLGCVFSIYLGSVIGLFYMTKFFYDYDIFANLEKLSFLKLEVSIPCIVNVLLLTIFDYFYESLAEHMTDQENHKTVNDFESNFIIKKFTLLLLSYFAPIFMITFLNQELGIDCAYGDCYLNGSYYFSSIFIILFLFNIKEIISPIFHKFLNKTKEEPKSFEDFGLINNYIEAEAKKESYFKSVDRYGTVDDYMEIIIQSGLLGLFAPLFPASMFIGFVWNALEMQTDKFKLLKYSQRPVPLDEQSIGIWGLLLEFLTNFSIIYNTGVVFLMGKKHPDRNGTDPPALKDVTMFLIIILISFTLRFIIETLIPESTFEFISIMKRQQYLLKSTIETFKKKTSKIKRLKKERNQMSRYVLFKPYGTILKIEKKKKAQIIQEEEDENDSYLDFEGEGHHDKEKDLDTERAAMPSVILLQKKPVLLHKNIYHYDFPKKKFIVAHMQKEYDNKIDRVKRMLKYFETKYTLKWCEQRLLYRRLYQKRRFILYKSLNVRKLKVFILAYRDLYYRFQKQQEAKKEEGIVEDNNDREQRTARINHLAKRKTKQAVKRTVILKSRGVWFGQFRRQVPILRAIDMILHLKKLEIIQNKQHITQKLIPITAIKITKDHLIKNRPRIFEQINYLDISKSSSQEVVKLLIQNKDQYIQREQYKSELVRNIEELYSLQTRKIEHIQTQIYHQEVPNYQTLAQEELKNLFVQNQKAQLRSQDFVLIKMIQKEQQKEIWLIKQNYQLKILEAIEIDLKYKNTQFQDLILQEFSLFDQFYFPTSKGIIGKIMDSRYELLNGWTLFDTVKFRKSVELFYEEQELLQFLFNLLNSFGDAKDNSVITPKSIYANRNKDRISYTFHWMIYGITDATEKNYIPSDESENIQLKKVYNAGMIILFMMTLGEIKDNLDFLVEQQAKFMNQYPIALTIISDMLLSEKQRKSYSYIKQLCGNECQSKELYMEDKRITYQIMEDSKIQELNYSELKLYDQNELSNQAQTEQLHNYLSQQIFKIDLLFKFKLLTSLKKEVDKCYEVASIIYNNENFIVHIMNNFNFYCDKPVHQKLLFDFISIEFYRSLYEFSNNLTLQGIYLSQFIPILGDIYHFLKKIEQYTSSAILDEYDQQSDILVIRKRLRVQAENYKNVHLKLQLIRMKFYFLQAYGEMLASNSTRAIDLFQQASKLNHNGIRFLIIQINIGKLQKDKQQCIIFLRKVDCKLEYYQLKIRNFILKLLLETESYSDALLECVIEKPYEQQCIFEQVLHSETLMLHSQIQWCLDRYQLNYDYLKNWIQKYKATQSKYLELPLMGLYSLELGINLLYYNQDIHLVEDYLQILYQFNDNELFLIHFLQYKLMQIINLQLGIISYGIITQFDENSQVAEKRLLTKSYSFLPKSLSRKSDFMSDLYFELECNLQMPMDYEQYVEHSEPHVVARRCFIIAKSLFVAQKYPSAKTVLQNTNSKIEGIVEAWRMKNNKMIDISYDCQFTLTDLSWKNLFITFIFDLNILNAQLVCRLAFKLIDCSLLQNKSELILVHQQFKIFLVKLLLEEYNDKNNNHYIEKSFEIKFFILSTLNQYLQDLSLNLLSEICDVEDKIRQKELLDYKDIVIPVLQREVEKKNICLNDLFVVQSQLLEESGDPVAALKCLDVQYALMLYDERFSKQVQQVFSRRLEHDDPNLLASKCKIAIMKLFLNIISNCGQQLLKIRKMSLESCVHIVTLTAEQSKQRVSEFPTTKVIWDENALHILNYAKPKQLEAFQKYKLIYYQTEWKLLEFYSITGDYKEALRQFQYLYNHYYQLTTEEDYVKKYFEYSFGVYFLYIRQTDKALKFFELAVKRFKKQTIYREDLKIPYVSVTGTFRDKFTDNKLIIDMLDQFNHLFTLRSRCSLYRCQVKIFEKQKDQYSLFRSMVRLIEKIRKTVGRKSILYVDALLVYSEFLLTNKEDNQFQSFKIAFKSQYFYTRREAEFFEPYIYKSSLPYKFATPEDIEERLSEQLVFLWIADLLEQCYKFYREYFNQVNVQEHFSIVYCDILQYRVAFTTGRLYLAQQMLDRATANLEHLCSSFDHPYGVLIFEGYALLCENMEKVQEENIKIILECAHNSQLNKLTQDERYRIVVQIYLRNEQLSQYFDDYKNNGFELYLLQKLEKFLDKKQITERISMKVGRLQRKYTSLDVGKQIQLKMLAKTEAMSNQDKIMNKKLKIGNIGYYRKAYKICKMIFKDSNSLYTRIEERFIELCRQEQREALEQ